MYRHILARDLKRKKTMNIILLIFIVIAATLVASSVNNITSITNALDTYFEKAELQDYYIFTISEESNNKKTEDFLKASEYCTAYTIDDCVFMSSDTLTYDGDKKFDGENMEILAAVEKSAQVFFDENNNAIKSVESGEIYIPYSVVEKYELKIGDTITLNAGDDKYELSIAGYIKDALLGSKMMGATRFLVNNELYDSVNSDFEASLGHIYAVQTSDVKEFKKAFNSNDISAVFNDSISIISMSYIMDLVVAGIMLVVSVVLILISLVLLRFTISFTLTEEFREIGIMKAIGLSNRKIGGLYILKYFVLSVLGSVIGLICSIPFGSLLLASVNNYIVMENDATSIIANIISIVAVICVIMLFCWLCTRRIKKFSPIDAMRSGNTGERFRRKGMHLSKSRLGAVPFMAFNDIISGLGKYTVLLIVFILGTLMMILPINSMNTLSSPSTISLFGLCDDCHLYINNSKKTMELMVSQREATIDYINDIEKTICDAGMPCTTYVDTLFSSKIEFNGNVASSLSYQSTNISPDKFIYNEGVAPKLVNEIAITKYTAAQIDAQIGDTIKVTTGSATDDFVITGTFQSMNNLGSGLRFSDEYDKLPYNASTGSMAVQVKFTDNPSDVVVQERMEKVKELLPEYEILDATDYIKTFLGSTVDQLVGIKTLIILIVILIDMLVAVLMVKSFITKERGQIAMLKSLGFSNGALIRWQTLRIGVIMLISTVIGALLSDPISQVSTALIFKMMGADSVKFVINPLEVFLFYPLIILAVTLFASVLATTQLIGIKAHETSGLE